MVSCQTFRQKAEFKCQLPTPNIIARVEALLAPPLVTSLMRVLTAEIKYVVKSKEKLQHNECK